MTASTEVLIGDPEAQFVLVRAVSRNHPGLFDTNDDDRVACEVEIAAGPFRAALQTDLRSQDFQAFLEEAEALTRVPDGTASFATPEEQIAFTLTPDGRGRLRVQGEACDSAESETRLRFAFEVDEEMLPQICRSLQVVVAAFPVRPNQPL